MADRILVDTNVLLYAYDRGEPVKQPRALSVLNSLVIHDLGILTSQVLAEFFVNATRKLQLPLTVEETYDRIQNYLESVYKYPLSVMPDVIRHPEGLEKTGFRLSPE